MGGCRKGPGVLALVARVLGNFQTFPILFWQGFREGSILQGSIPENNEDSPKQEETKPSLGYQVDSEYVFFFFFANSGGHSSKILEKPGRAQSLLLLPCACLVAWLLGAYPDAKVTNSWARTFSLVVAHNQSDLCLSKNASPAAGCS